MTLDRDWPRHTLHIGHGLVKDCRLVVEILEPVLERLRLAVKGRFLSFAFHVVLLGVYVRPEFIQTDEPRV